MGRRWRSEGAGQEYQMTGNMGVREDVLQGLG